MHHIQWTQSQGSQYQNSEKKTSEFVWDVIKFEWKLLNFDSLVTHSVDFYFYWDADEIITVTKYLVNACIDGVCRASDTSCRLLLFRTKGGCIRHYRITIEKLHCAGAPDVQTLTFTARLCVAEKSIALQFENKCATLRIAMNDQMIMHGGDICDDDLV